ncbi:MAG: HDIG domain-containing protein [Dehalococcoidia bacterium]|nr:HDIG domain-containing protein [Dehalococcoidia bacterium]
MTLKRGPGVVSTTQILLFVVGLALVFGFILFPLSPADRLEAGDISDETIVAPRDLSYVSAIRTEDRRETAASTVDPVVGLDPGIREQQLRALEQRLEEVGAIRARVDLSDNQKASELSSLEAPAIPGPVAVIIAERGEEPWQQIVQEADRLLDSVMLEAMSAEQIEDVRLALRERVAPELGEAEALVVTALVGPYIQPNVIVDEAATGELQEAARSEVEPVRVERSEGEVIVRNGEVITEESLEVLEEAGLLSPGLDLEDAAGVSGLSILAALTLGVYLYYLQPPALASERRLMLVLIACAAVVLAAKLYLPEMLPDEERRFLMFILPVAAAPMVIAALLEDTPFAVLVAAVLAGLCAFSGFYLPESPGALLGRPLDTLALFFGYFFGSVAGVFAVNRATSITQYFFAAVGTTVGTIAGAYSMVLLDPAGGLEDIGWLSISAGGGGLLAAMITVGVFVLVGTLFGITTRLQLMEMAEINHPLLRRLQEEAPGTFHHSVVVGTLAERAANMIGGDALQARTGAYYHDIGKMVKPHYYIENTADNKNPHDDLGPAQSAKIVADHVRNGLELARKHGLPQVIRDFIPQHHGTRLVTYFYRKAVQEGQKVNPDQFRYPGPKPQRRETAIVMLADSVEALVRAHDDKSAPAIEFSVQGVIRERLQEGQLDESDLTLRDLQMIAQSFKETLIGVHHPRIEYPQPTAEEQLALRGGTSDESRPDPFSTLR